MIAQIVTAGFFATMAMTIFSYITSRLFHHNFREPQLLNILLDRLPNAHLAIAKEHVVGWAIHLSVGFLFVFVFIMLREVYTYPLDLFTGVIFGIIAGVFGASVWRLCFALHPDPPKTKTWQFLFHLIFAHIVFGSVMVWCLQWMTLF